MTAAHASKHWLEGDYENIWIGFGNYQDGVDGKETVYKVSAIHRHPHMDLALYSVESPIQGIPSAKIHQEVLLVNQPIAFGGFGRRRGVYLCRCGKRH